MILKYEPASEPLHIMFLVDVVSSEETKRKMAGPLSSELEQISHSRPDSGLGLRHFQYEILPSCSLLDRLGRGTTRANDAQGTPTQSHISPRILVYEDYRQRREASLPTSVLDQLTTGVPPS